MWSLISLLDRRLGASLGKPEWPRANTVVRAKRAARDPAAGDPVAPAITRGGSGARAVQGLSGADRAHQRATEPRGLARHARKPGVARLGGSTPPARRRRIIARRGATAIFAKGRDGEARAFDAQRPSDPYSRLRRSRTKFRSKPSCSSSGPCPSWI